MHHFARDGRVGQKGRHKSSPARIFMTPLRPPPKSAIHFIRALMTAAPYGYTYTYIARPEIIFTRREINYISDESCYRDLYHGTVAGWWKLRFYEYPLFQKRNTAFINNRNIDPTTNSSLSASEVFYYLFTESTFYLWNIKIVRERALLRYDLMSLYKWKHAIFIWLTRVVSIPGANVAYLLFAASWKERKVKFTWYSF